MDTSIQDLEEKIRSALHYRAEQLPPTSLTGDAPNRPERKRTASRAFVVAAAAVVLAVAVVAVLVSKQGTDREAPAAPTGFVPCTIKDPGNFVGPDGTTFGPTPSPDPKGGTLSTEEIDAMPDYISVACETDTVGGWVKKVDMFGTGPAPVMNGGDVLVYADNGTTIVGHIGNGNGFAAVRSKVTEAQRRLADRDASLAEGCKYSQDKPAHDADGLTITALMSRWIEVIGAPPPNPLPGCIPRELLFPDLDGGRALAAYKTRAGFPVGGSLRPPFPVFAVDGTLAGFEGSDGQQPAFITITTTSTNGRVPASLIDDPPTPGDFSSDYTNATPTGRYYYDGPCPPGQVPSPLLAPPDCVAAKTATP
ncbi:MAG TPA: hypothetical protein VGN51_07650 [Acidimicrobiia bacterium]|jgi:hypothetical protein